ncbi:hypothetical protein COOONC_14328 [Cooperia oncophora]
MQKKPGRISDGVNGSQGQSRATCIVLYTRKVAGHVQYIPPVEFDGKCN